MQRDIIEYEERYSEDAFGFEKYKVIFRRRKILEAINRYQPGAVLEIGCGLEPLFCYDKDRKYTVIEPSKKFYERALYLSRQNSHVTCIRGFFEETASALQERNERYDMVVCSALLHEVERPESLLKAIKEVCSGETIIHINVPNMYSMHRLLGVETGILSDIFDKSEGNIRLRQHTNFDLQKLKTMVEGNGMTVEEEGSYFVKPFSHRQMQEMMENQIINESVLEGLYRLAEHMPQFGSEIYVNCRVKGQQRNDK